MPKSTMYELSYGINKPRDLLNKLIFEGDKINENPHPYDLFNFFVTAAVLNEWVVKYYSNYSFITMLNPKTLNIEGLPKETALWIVDKSCLPDGFNEQTHVYNAMKICWDTTNASKHFNWKDLSKVSAIEANPIVKSPYQYFFTSIEPSIYIEYAEQYYSVLQIKQILNQFYLGLFNHIEILADKT